MSNIQEPVAKTARQTLVLKDRSLLTLDGVSGISEFSGGILTLDVDGGRFTVEGSDLRVDDLDRENRKISVSGEIDAMYFSQKSEIGKRTGGWFFRKEK